MEWLRYPKRMLWLFICAALLLIVATHYKGAIISFDEGFHGGAAVYFIETIKHFFSESKAATSPEFLRLEFKNGVVLYPHLWTIAATALGLLFGSSVEVFRLATLIFYTATIVGTYWFITKAHGKQLAGLSAATILATIPMVIIYSHLMMLEVPLLFGVTAMVTTFYVMMMNLVPRNGTTLLSASLVFLLAPHAKLPAAAVAWGTIITFILIASLIYRKRQFYRRILKPELLWFFVLTVASLTWFILFERHYWQANMVDFFVAQSQSGQRQNILRHALSIAWENRVFYLNDFRHIPLLALIWFGSTIGYFAWKRTPLGLLLIVWALVSYIAFSGVKPQVAQYLMPIYAPFAFATGLVIFDATARIKPQKRRATWVTVLTGSVIFLQLMSIPKSEAFGWKTKQTGQLAAASYVLQHAQPEDRVISWHDGTIFALRVDERGRRLQIIHGEPQVCPDAMRDSYEWAISVDEPPYPTAVDTRALQQSPWRPMARFGSDHSTIVFKNQNRLIPATIEGEYYDPERSITDTNASNFAVLRITDLSEQPTIWGCARLFPLGMWQAKFLLKPLLVPNEFKDNENILRLEYKAYPYGEESVKNITAGELREAQSRGGYQPFLIELDRKAMNTPGEFRVIVHRRFEGLLDAIIVTPKS